MRSSPGLSEFNPQSRINITAVNICDISEALPSLSYRILIIRCTGIGSSRFFANDHNGDGYMNDNKPEKKITERQKQVRMHLILLIFFSALLLIGAIYLIIRFTPTNKKISYEEYFGTMEENEAAIVLQDQILEDYRALISETGAVYLPQELVRDYLNERFFWDEENSKIRFTTATQTMEIPVNSASYTVLDGTLPEDPSTEASYEDVIVLRSKGDTLYLNLSFIAGYTNIAYSFNEDTPHVFIRTEWGKVLSSHSLKEAAVRFEGGIKSPIVTELQKGEDVTVLETSDHWLKVLTNDGLIGWVKANRMSEPETIELQNEGFTPVEYPSVPMDGKVTLTWQMITTLDDNKNFANATEGLTGFNVISPTWFALSDNSGNVNSLGSKAYVDEAHQKGLQVWGVINDFSPDMDNSVMLASTTARQNCIRQLMGYVETFGLDGINVDFEHIDPGDAFTYTQFIRELSIVCRKASKVLSVDTYPPYDFNAYLNRKEIATVCDYLINMGYDEHYYGGDTAGSVASLEFQRSAIANLKIIGVPMNKLISAVPLYTRIWYTSSDTEGNYYIDSEVLSMSGVASTLDSWSLTPVWDPVTAQNYVSWYTDEGVLCQIWIEDDASLERKALLVPANNLAGIAAWALGFEVDSVWSTMSETIKTPHDEAVAKYDELQAKDDALAKEQLEQTLSTETEGSGPVAVG